MQDGGLCRAADPLALQASQLAAVAFQADADLMGETQVVRVQQMETNPRDADSGKHLDYTNGSWLTQFGLYDDYVAVAITWHAIWHIS